MDTDLLVRKIAHGVGVVCLMAIILFYFIHLCRDLCQKYINSCMDEIYPDDIVIRNMGATELRQQPQRCDHGHDNVSSDQVDTNEEVGTTQLDGEATGIATGNGGVDNVNGDKDVVKLSEQKERSNKPYAADHNGIKSDGDHDTFDKFDDSKTTASGNSARSPSLD